MATNRAVKLNLLPTNPCAAVAKPRYVRADIFPFTLEESRSIMDEMIEHPLHAVFVLAFTIGMREGELFGLPWECVDLNAGCLDVRWQLAEESGRLQLKPPKTKASIRTIELPGRAVTALVERRKRAFRDGHAAVKQVFCTENGRMVRRSNFGRRVWKPLLERLGLTH